MARKADQRLKHVALMVLANIYDEAQQDGQGSVAAELADIDPTTFGYDDQFDFENGVQEYIEAILEGEFEQRTSTR